MSEIHVSWEWPLKSQPAALWPLISNTDRFNADSGVPQIEQLGQSEFRRSLRHSRLGVAVEWEEEPFEWTEPERFGVIRRYRSGPLVEMRVLAELLDGPSRLRYQVWATARNWIGRLLVALQLKESRYRFGRTIRAYDDIAAHDTPTFPQPQPAVLVPGGPNRLERARRELLARGVDDGLVSRLCRLVEQAADRDVSRIRPYALANEWGAGRRTILELFLRATHAGLLEFEWRVLCPLCRGAKQKVTELSEVDPRVHCEACNIDFQSDFERSVELTFHPSPAIRKIEVFEYCVGGPQNMPHIVMQQILEPFADRTVRLALEPGAYRFRRWGQASGRTLRVAPEMDHLQAAPEESVLDGESGPELRVSTAPAIVLRNPSSETRLVVLERTAWRDEAATAADVTALQVFRELFAGEALRPAVPLPVGNLTVMFTDLVDSTRLYREFGDAAAFTRVLQQQNILAKAVEAEGGAVVKTLGDRTMAVFRRPILAMRSAARAQHALAWPVDPLRLRIGIHTGPSVAVTLNDRLDYFGTTVNLASRLSGLSQGDDMVASGAVLDDPEVCAWLSAEGVRQEKVEVNWKGFEPDAPEVFRLRQARF